MDNLSESLNRSFNIKIFSLNRIKYEQLWDDAVSFVKKVYQGNDEEYNSSSPFAQLLSVILHLGRMVIYYIEDAINGLNIMTAWRPDQIRGLASLTGHDPGRSVGARAAVRLTYNGNDSNYTNKIVYIPDKLQMTNVMTGLNYILLLGGTTARFTLAPGNYFNANIVQGKISRQRATSDGSSLQSYNFAERNYKSIDQYHVNVYVNDEPWKTVNNFLDMAYEDKSCVVKTGQTGGLDVFFGNGDFGAIPPSGAKIDCEYLTNSGEQGNFVKEFMNSSDYWSFVDKGYLADGTEVDLTPLIKMECLTDAIFGAYYEDVTLTKRIAPYSSRSMVLANSVNYKYFLEKMKMFSVIDVLQGYNTVDDRIAENDYQKVQNEYIALKRQYESAVNLYGRESDMATQLSNEIVKKSKALQRSLEVLENTKFDDNTVYLFLVPDIKQRIQSFDDYFTCDIDSTFKLTDDEKYNILNLINMSGQSIISVDNKILDVMYPKFAINITVRLWQNVEFENIYSSIISRLSNYFVSNIRRDRIPCSDIIAICEDINGIDSVSVYFEADPNNKNLYMNDFDGIDEYGDVILERKVLNRLGENVVIRDLFPLFRGGFITEQGIEYSDVQSKDVLSAVNISVSGYSNTNLQTNIENKLIG